MLVFSSVSVGYLVCQRGTSDEASRVQIWLAVEFCSQGKVDLQKSALHQSSDLDLGLTSDGDDFQLLRDLPRQRRRQLQLRDQHRFQYLLDRVHPVETVSAVISCR